MITVGAITKLFWVINYSSSTLTITNLEPPNPSAACPPKTSTYLKPQHRVPWCTRRAEFANHHIEITLSGVTYSVWQHTDTDGNWVRRSTTGFTSSEIDPSSNPAPRFPGTAKDGGDRLIEVGPDGVFSLRELY